MAGCRSLLIKPSVASDTISLSRDFAKVQFLGDAYFLLERYEEAIAEQKRHIALNPGDWGPYARLTMIYSELGWEEEARAAVAEVLRLNPNFTLATARQTWPMKDPADLERVLAALRKEGLE